MLTLIGVAVMVGASGAWERWKSAPVPPTGSADAAASDPWRHLAAATAQAELGRPAADAEAAGASLAQWQAHLAALPGASPERAWQQALAWASLRPGWAQALVEPLLEPLWQRRMFEGMLEALDDASGLEASLRGTWTDATLARWTETAPTQAALWAAKRVASSAASSSASGAATGMGAEAVAGSGPGTADGARSAAGAADLLAKVNDRWANQDARSATVFASTLPPAIGRPLLTESLNRWLALDGPAARLWIRSQGASPALDASIVQHATQDELARQSPQEAIELVRRITDPSLRQQAQWALARTFRDIDPTQDQWQAQALAGGAALPAEDTPGLASDSGPP